MTSPLERRYRRVLRLLPNAYRQAWEEDMVAAFLESAEHSATGWPTLSERLSVVSLAVRLRLNGSHATPRWALWYHVVYGIALLVLLYQAVAATAVAVVFSLVLRSTMDVGAWYASPFVWSKFVGLLWVAAFVCLVLRRNTATRVLALLAVMAEIAVTSSIVLAYGTNLVPLGLSDISRWGWLAVSGAVVLVTPRDGKASPRLWLGALAIGSLLVLITSLRAFVPLMADYWQRVHFGDLNDISTVALVAALTVVLARRHWEPHWLLALAIVGGAIGGMHTSSALTRVVPPFGLPAPVDVSTALDALLIGLAVVALVVGLLGWHRSVPTVGDPAGGGRSA